jgi:hypothetical protein
VFLFQVKSIACVLSPIVTYSFVGVKVMGESPVVVVVGVVVVAAAVDDSEGRGFAVVGDAAVDAESTGLLPTGLLPTLTCIRKSSSSP